MLSCLGMKQGEFLQLIQACFTCEYMFAKYGVFQILFLVYSTAQYFASTMMIVGMSVVVTVIVLQFHHHDPHGGKMPKWVSDR